MKRTCVTLGLFVVSCVDITCSLKQGTGALNVTHGALNKALEP